MTTAPFRAGFARLEALASEAPTAVLCAERDWKRCHRQLLADLWVARGGCVLHLVDEGRSEPHRLNEWARPVGGDVTYPGLI